MKPNSLSTCQPAIAAALLSVTIPLNAETERPNILWIIADDLSVDLGCYGNRDVTTPNLDRLGAEGALFTNAYVTAPVCSPSRSAFQTGMYQTSIDAQHQRSHRQDGYTLPEPARLLSHRFRAAGYYTANIKEITPDLKVAGKTDLNFRTTRPFDGHAWSELASKQPFFAQINFLEPHRGDAWVEARKQSHLVDPGKVTLPPVYPDHPIMRDVWANYLDAINLLDRKVGVVLELLEKQGLAKNTIVVFFGDNGRPMFRGKGTLYDGGLAVPLLVRWPGKIKPGTVRPDLISLIDLAPTMLGAAGIEPAADLPGQDFLAAKSQPRRAVFAARDRLDEVEDTIRAVRTNRFKYIRNFQPGRSALEDSAHTRRAFPEFELFRELNRRRLLSPAQQSVVRIRDDEELYDLESDPWELRNLASDPKHQLMKEMLRHSLMEWITATNDTGAVPEREIIMPAEWYERNGVPSAVAK